MQTEQEQVREAERRLKELSTPQPGDPDSITAFRRVQPKMGNSYLDNIVEKADSSYVDRYDGKITQRDFNDAFKVCLLGVSAYKADLTSRKLREDGGAPVRLTMAS